MFISLKNKFFIIILLIFATSCVIRVDDPAKKYNEAFLKKNSRKIKKNKEKHKKIAKEKGVFYTNNTTQIIDVNYYNNKTKNKKFYKQNKIKNKEELILLDTNETIYYKDKESEDLIKPDKYNEKEGVLYLQNNYVDYSEDSINFNDIVIPKESLYGELKERKKKKYKQIDPSILQVNFDYIYLMDKVKKEIYINNIENSENIISINNEETKDTKTNIKDKFKKLFNK